MTAVGRARPRSRCHCQRGYRAHGHDAPLHPVPSLGTAILAPLPLPVLGQVWGWGRDHGPQGRT